jgi:hypothetical protein
MRDRPIDHTRHLWTLLTPGLGPLSGASIHHRQKRNLKALVDK